MKILRENLRKEVKLGRLTRGGFSRLPILLLHYCKQRLCTQSKYVLFSDVLLICRRRQKFQSNSSLLKWKYIGLLMNDDV